MSVCGYIDKTSTSFFSFSCSLTSDIKSLLLENLELKATFSLLILTLNGANAKQEGAERTAVMIRFVSFILISAIIGVRK